MTTQRLSRAIPLLATLLLSAASASGGDTRVIHEIDSEHTTRAQTIEVSLPRSYDDHPESEFPVLVLLDGESNLDHATAVAEYLAEAGSIPEMIVVGVHAGASRSQDYAFAPVQAGMPAHGERYLEFIRAEVLPMVQQEYRAAPLRLISGHSLGGAFVTSVLAERPELFAAFIAQSPYLPGGFGESILKELRAAIESPAFAGAFYYANLGDEPDIRQSFNALTGLVAESGKLRAVTETHPGETHMSTRLIGLYNGLKGFFGPAWRFDAENGSLRDHVESVSKTYGYDALYAESVYQQHVQQALGAGDTAGALDAARLYADQHSYSPVPHLLLSAALARSGDIERARAAIRLSVEKYDADPRDEWAAVEPSIRALARQLGADRTPSP